MYEVVSQRLAPAGYKVSGAQPDPSTRNRKDRWGLRITKIPSAVTHNNTALHVWCVYANPRRAIIYNVITSTTNLEEP